MVDDEMGAETGIEMTFQWKLASVIALPRADRRHARRAAKRWRIEALRALRHRRKAARYARWLMRQASAPVRHLAPR